MGILIIVGLWTTMKLRCLVSSLFLIIIMIHPGQGCKPDKGCSCCFAIGWKSSGCKICDPAPEGYRCECTVRHIWYCTGESVKCSDEEKKEYKCPGDCKSHVCCHNGGGNCRGYLG